MKNDLFEMKIESGMFAVLRADMNASLRKTVEAMQQYDVTEAKITLALNITLDKRYCFDDPMAETVTTIPTFEHKVSATMQMKDEWKGRTGGAEFELIQDEKNHGFYVRVKDSGQISMLDEGDESDGN